MAESMTVFKKGFIFLLSFANQMMLVKYFTRFLIGLDLLGWYTQKQILKNTL